MTDTPTSLGDDRIGALRARMLREALVFSSALLAVCLVAALIGRMPPAVVGFECLGLALVALIHRCAARGRTGWAAAAFLALAFAVTTASIASLGTIRVPAAGLYLAMVMAAGLLLEVRVMWGMIALSSLTVAGLIVAENKGLLPRPDYAVSFTQWLVSTAIFTCVGAWTVTALRGLQRMQELVASETAGRRESESELRASLARYRRIESATSDGYWERDLVSGEAYHSPRELEILGYGPADMPASYQAFVELIHPEDRDRLGLSMEPINRGEEAFSLELRVRRRTGEFIWVQSRGQMEVDDAGKPVRISGAITDISQRKRELEELRESKAYNSALIQAIPDLIFIIRRDGEFLSAHASDPTMFYVQPENFLHRRVGEVLPRSLSGQFMRIIEAVLDTRAAQELGYSLEIGGRMLQFEARFIPHSPETVLCLVRDMTERRRIEEALRASESLFRTAFNDSPLLMTIVDHATGRYLQVNDSFCQVSGFSREELIGRTSVEIGWVESDVRAKTLRELNESLFTQGLEMDFRRKSGKTVHCRLWADLIPTAQGLRLFAMAEDLTERKQAEAALVESEERFRAIAHLSPDIITIFDRYGRIRFNSPAAAKVHGYQSAELEGKPIFDLIHPDDRPSVVDAFSRLLQARSESSRFQYRYRNADGSYRWMEAYSRNLLENPHINGILSIVRDVTERKWTELEARRLAREQKIILDHANIGISLVRDRRQVWLNDKAAEMLGYPKEGLVGESTRRLYPSEEAYKKLDREAYPVLAEGRVYETVQELVRGDGTHIWVRYNGKAIDPADMSQGTLWLLEDITGQLAQERQMRDSNEKFNQLAANITSVFWITSPDFSVMHFVSPAYEQIWGRSTARLYARPQEWEEAILPEDQDRVMADLARLSAGQPLACMEYRIRRPDGDVRWIQDRAFPVRDAAGQLERLAGIATDITEQVKQREKLEEMLGQNQRDAQFKGELLREVNHRVTNNLSSIQGLMVHEYNALKLADQPTVPQVLDRLTRRIDGMITAHRLLSSSQWAPVRVDTLAEMVVHAALSADPDSRTARIAIRPSELEVSPRQASNLALVLNELTTNSIKHAKTPGKPLTLSLESSTDREFIAICYRDNGPGLPTEIVVGQQGHLGLKLIRQLVTSSLRGELTLDNDAGAVVKIRLPCEELHRT